MKDPDPNIEPRPEIGTVFHSRRFDRPKADGVARGYQLTGWYDFPNGGFALWVENGLQKVRIAADAPTNGDAGIERHIAVTPGDVYRLTARLRVVGKTGKFKGRVNLSARRRDGSQVREFNAAQEDVTDTAVERTVEAVVPRGTTFLSARVKFHTSAPGESGEGEIERMDLERLVAPTVAPAGPRVSIYNFNIHKMRDDWRGWITYIVQQKLAPPDIVLVQDIAHDADRELLQEALGAAFGGTWAGAGSDAQWQTAIVWRTRRFSRATVRAWRGFGGRSCVDDSQDAPALQAKLYHGAADKWISLVSLKTPPGVSDSCAWSNIHKVHHHFEPPWSGHLCVIGTDANAPDRDPEGQWLPWYQRTVASELAGLEGPGTLRYVDPVTESARGDPDRLAEHATRGRNRIDFLLLKAPWNDPPKIVRQMTLPRGNAAGVRWSDHRGLHVEVAY